MKSKKPIITIISILILIGVIVISLRFYSIHGKNHDILPNTNESKGDIPKLASILRKARDKHDLSICDSLPEPLHQEFRIYDTGSANPAPTRDEWYLYCKALVIHDVSLCQEPTVIQSPLSNIPPVTLPPNYRSYPDLMLECRSVFDRESN
jgi:hypothetical protein